MNKSTIGLLGGSGFIGSVLANRLVEAGYAVRVFTRRRLNARELWLLPDTDIVEVDYFDQEQLNDAFEGVEAVVNFVAILNERGDNGDGFRRVHVDLVQKVIRACKAADVPHVVQMSALNADSFAASHYLRSKGEAEKLLAAENSGRLTATIMRPSVVFGRHDDFINRFARLLRLSPGFFPLACAGARFQPVYVGDVADAIVRTLRDPSRAGERYDLGGPDVVTLREVVEFIARITERRVRVIPLGPRLASLQANLLEYVPGKPFSRDNLRSLQEDSVCAGTNGLDELGIEPTPMDVVVPTYLGDRNQRHRFYRYRAEAGRD